MRHLSIPVVLVAGCLAGGGAWAQIGSGSSVGSSPSVGGTTGNSPSLSNQGLMGTGGRISNQGLQGSTGSIAEEGLQDITGSPQRSDIGAAFPPTDAPPELSSTEDAEVDLGPAGDIAATPPRLPPAAAGGRAGASAQGGDPAATGSLRDPTGGLNLIQENPPPMVERLIQEEAVEERGICVGC